MGAEASQNKQSIRCLGPHSGFGIAGLQGSGSRAAIRTGAEARTVSLHSMDRLRLGNYVGNSFKQALDGIGAQPLDA